MIDLVGKEIKIITMAGEHGYNGKSGVVIRIDEMGQLHGICGGFAVNPYDDRFDIIS